MKRRHVNFKKSAKKFEHKAKRTHKLNSPAHKSRTTARGGYRL